MWSSSKGTNSHIVFSCIVRKYCGRETKLKHENMKMLFICTETGIVSKEYGCGRQLCSHWSIDDTVDKPMYLLIKKFQHILDKN